jgi:hypothetical protein
MKYNKAPEPDGFPTEFQQKIWDIIKIDHMELFDVLHAG